MADNEVKEVIEEENNAESVAEEGKTNGANLEDRVNESLGEIRQILETDGGGIELVEITEDMTAKVRLLGHCAGCMGARMTMSGIVEQILQDQVPEIKGVEAVE